MSIELVAIILAVMANSFNSIGIENSVLIAALITLLDSLMHSKS